MNNQVCEWLIGIAQVQRYYHPSNRDPESCLPLKSMGIQEITLLAFLVFKSQGDWISYEKLQIDILEDNIVCPNQVDCLLDRLEFYYQVVVTSFQEEKVIKSLSYQEHQDYYDPDISVRYLTRFFEENK